MRLTYIMKIIRDLKNQKTRTFLAVLAISVGIISASFILIANSVLTREINVFYNQTNPASATLITSKIDQNFLQELQKHPLVENAEIRHKITGRVKKGEEWIPLWLFIIDDYNNIKIDVVTSEQGQWPPKNNTILIERHAFKVANKKIGDNITVKLPGGIKRKLPITGGVHAPGLAQAWMEGVVYGYITQSTLAFLGVKNDKSEIKIIVSKNKMDKDAVMRALSQLELWIKKKGITIYSTDIPTPGIHPHAKPMNSFLLILQLLGLLAMLLSCILVVNMISALLSRQIKQIGIMKVIGGSSLQIAGIYFGTVLTLGIISLIISLPLGIMFGKIYINTIAYLLNFNIINSTIEPWVYLSIIAIGVALPLICAAFPILKGSRISPIQAIHNHGIDANNSGNDFIDNISERFTFLSRPFLLSIRNTFRQKIRFFLTMLTLSLGGAIFIVAMNFRASLSTSVDSVFFARGMDIELTLHRYYPEDKLKKIFQSITGVKSIVGIINEKAAVSSVANMTYELVNINVLPGNQNLINPKIISGHWLAGEDTNGVVINHGLATHLPGIKAGEYIKINFKGEIYHMRVIGIAREIAIPPTVYITKKYYSSIIKDNGAVNDLLIVTNDHSAQDQLKTIALIENTLKKHNIEPLANTRMTYYRQVIVDHLQITFTLLLIMSLLIIIVGGLGLMSTMSINVMERTREIGVMRAIGASTFSILKIITVEGTLIGFASWIIAVLLSPFATYYMGSLFGQMMFQTPLATGISIKGMAVWLFFVTILSFVASFWPALKAANTAVKDALAYE